MKKMIAGIFLACAALGIGFMISSIAFRGGPIGSVGSDPGIVVSLKTADPVDKLQFAESSATDLNTSPAKTNGVTLALSVSAAFDDK